MKIYNISKLVNSDILSGSTWVNVFFTIILISFIIVLIIIIQVNYIKIYLNFFKKNINILENIYLFNFFILYYIII